MWDTGGMIDMEQPNYLEKNMSQCHFVHTKNHTWTAPGVHIASAALQGQLWNGLCYNTRGNYFSLDIHIQGYGICGFNL